MRGAAIRQVIPARAFPQIFHWQHSPHPARFVLVCSTTVLLYHTCHPPQGVRSIGGILPLSLSLKNACARISSLSYQSNFHYLLSWARVTKYYCSRVEISMCTTFFEIAKLYFGRTLVLCKNSTHFLATSHFPSTYLYKSPVTDDVLLYLRKPHDP